MPSCIHWCGGKFVGGIDESERIKHSLVHESCRSTGVGGDLATLPRRGGCTLAANRACVLCWDADFRREDSAVSGDTRLQHPYRAADSKATPLCQPGRRSRALRLGRGVRQWSETVCRYLFSTAGYDSAPNLGTATNVSHAGILDTGGAEPMVRTVPAPVRPRRPGHTHGDTHWRRGEVLTPLRPSISRRGRIQRCRCANACSALRHALRSRAR
jgi:hypothetical protein